ncbi:putative membrane protein, partial [Escherichia coli 3.4870]
MAKNTFIFFFFFVF